MQLLPISEYRKDLFLSRCSLQFCSVQVLVNQKYDDSVLESTYAAEAFCGYYELLMKDVSILINCAFYC